jgi:hypothetical protein
MRKPHTRECVQKSPKTSRAPETSKTRANGWCEVWGPAFSNVPRRPPEFFWCACRAGGLPLCPRSCSRLFRAVAGGGTGGEQRREHLSEVRRGRSDGPSEAFSEEVFSPFLPFSLPRPAAGEPLRHFSAGKSAETPFSHPRFEKKGRTGRTPRAKPRPARLEPVLSRGERERERGRTVA